MFSADFMSAQVKQVGNSGMSTEESLRLSRRLESSHPSLPHPSRLVRLLGSVVLILLSTVDRVPGEFLILQ